VIGKDGAWRRGMEGGEEGEKAEGVYEGI